MAADPLFVHLAIGGMNHHTADVDMLEQFRFADEELFFAEIQFHFKGAILLQTCNRVEVLVQGTGAGLTEFLQAQRRAVFEVREDLDAIRHLLEVACGIDSMIVGEDQILGQLKKALAAAQVAGVCSPLVEQCVNKAVHVGVEVRRRTEINRGAVSIGSAAVTLAEELLGTLTGRHILVIGSGEIGLLVTQALAAKDLTAIYVANRTYDRAVQLASKIGGKAVTMAELYRYLVLSDVVISCTSAPHPIIRCQELKEVMKGRCWPLEGHPRPLILIDIAQPRDVEEGADQIDGVHLCTIDNLRTISQNNLDYRKSEASRAQSYIEDELNQFVQLINRKAADDHLSMLHSWAEQIRVRERDRALARLGTEDQRAMAVVDDLTRVLVKKLLTDATFSIRASAECGEMEAAASLVHAITQGEKLCIQRRE